MLRLTSIGTGVACLAIACVMPERSSRLVECSEQGTCEQGMECYRGFCVEGKILRDAATGLPSVNPDAQTILLPQDGALDQPPEVSSTLPDAGAGPATRRDAGGESGGGDAAVEVSGAVEPPVLRDGGTTQSSNDAQVAVEPPPMTEPGVVDAGTTCKRGKCCPKGKKSCAERCLDGLLDPSNCASCIGACVDRECESKNCRGGS